MRLAMLLVLVVACSKEPAPVVPASTAQTAEPATSGAPTKEQHVTDEISITDPSQREAAVGKKVVVVGIQTRTKQPQVNGVDVDGEYELSDKKVVARGILEKHVVNEPPPKKGDLVMASRGNGTFYSVIDPETKRLATTKLAE